MMFSYGVVLIIICAGMFLSARTKKLTWQAAIAGGVIGFLIFIAEEYTGLLLMSAFFLLGTAATSYRKHEKDLLHLEEENKTGRTSGQVFANAGVAGLLAVISIIFRSHTLLWGVMIAASFSSATADTLSSELGNVFGNRFYNITTLRADERGLNGVVSFEGTMAGVAGSLVIATIYCLGKGWTASHFFIIIAAGTFGNFFDSLLGASLERKHQLNNNAVNFLNTLVAAVFAGVAFFLF